jgi:hypothetical protein
MLKLPTHSGFHDLFLKYLVRVTYTIYQIWHFKVNEGPLWLWSYGSWINNYLCSQCLSPLTLWIWIPLRRGVLHTTLCDQVCQRLVTGRWFSPGTPVSSTNKTDRHNLTEILLKVALNTINQTYMYIYQIW